MRTDGLWRHTCFEAFIAPGGVERILGIQLFSVGCLGGLSLHRLPRRHDAARRGRRAASSPSKPARRNSRSLRRWTWAGSRGRADVAGLRLGLTAVIEDRAQGLSYWALKHGAEKPDFHRADSFVVALA